MFLNLIFTSPAVATYLMIAQIDFFYEFGEWPFLHQDIYFDCDAWVYKKMNFNWLNPHIHGDGIRLPENLVEVPLPPLAFGNINVHRVYEPDDIGRIIEEAIAVHRNLRRNALIDAANRNNLIHIAEGNIGDLGNRFQIEEAHRNNVLHNAVGGINNVDITNVGQELRTLYEQENNQSNNRTRTILRIVEDGQHGEFVPLNLSMSSNDALIDNYDHLHLNSIGGINDVENELRILNNQESNRLDSLADNGLHIVGDTINHDDTRIVEPNTNHDDTRIVEPNTNHDDTRIVEANTNHDDTRIVEANTNHDDTRIVEANTNHDDTRIVEPNFDYYYNRIVEADTNHNNTSIVEPNFDYYYNRIVEADTNHDGNHIVESNSGTNSLHIAEYKSNYDYLNVSEYSDNSEYFRMVNGSVNENYKRFEISDPNDSGKHSHVSLWGEKSLDYSIEPIEKINLDIARLINMLKQNTDAFEAINSNDIVNNINTFGRVVIDDLFILDDDVYDSIFQQDNNADSIAPQVTNFINNINSFGTVEIDDFFILDDDVYDRIFQQDNSIEVNNNRVNNDNLYRKMIQAGIKSVTENKPK